MKFSMNTLRSNVNRSFGFFLCDPILGSMIVAEVDNVATFLKAFGCYSQISPIHDWFYANLSIPKSPV